MKKGKEPMRTFGDLMQFFEAKDDDKKPPQKGPKEAAARPASPAADVPPSSPPNEASAADVATPPETKLEAHANGTASGQEAAPTSSAVVQEMPPVAESGEHSGPHENG